MPLRACPFCNKIPTIEPCQSNEGFSEFYLQHYCNFNGVEIDISIYDINKNSIVKAWNTRNSNKDYVKGILTGAGLNVATISKVINYVNYYEEKNSG